MAKKPFGNLKKGALHSELGIPQGQQIPLKTLQAAAKKPGIEGQRARFALNARNFHHPAAKGKK